MGGAICWGITWVFDLIWLVWAGWGRTCLVDCLVGCFGIRVAASPCV